MHNLNELLHSAITEGSRKTYQRAWTTYVDFSSEFCESHASLLPVSVNNLALFISYLSARKFASSTISTYVSALGYVHKLANFPDPTKNFLVQKILAAHSKLYSAPDVRLPITRGVLQRLVLALNHTNSSAYQRLLFQTMFLVAFYGFFRVGELTAKGANLKPFVQIQNLHFQLKDSCVTAATIVIADYKHNFSRRPFSVLLDCATGTDFCPVNYLQRYCSMRGTTPGALFCFADGSPVKTSHFTQQLRQALNFCGLDSSKYKSHSFRIGAASSAANNGLSDAQIRHLGRWKSDAFKLYIRQSSEGCKI